MAAMDGLFHGKSHLKMDDWGYPHDLGNLHVNKSTMWNRDTYSCNLRYYTQSTCKFLPAVEQNRRDRRTTHPKEDRRRCGNPSDLKIHGDLRSKPNK